MKRAIWALVLVLAIGFGFFGYRGSQAGEVGAIQIDGLLAPVRLVDDSDGIPHIFAENDHDVFFMMGYVHARDRFFQMDSLRRTFSGTLAELLGPAALPSDIQLRTLGLRRAAEESLPAYSPELQAVFESYADGVNAWLDDPGHPLPPEYGALELTTAAPWTAVDCVTMAKGLAFSLSFDSDDLDFTEALLTFEAVGDQAGFDGQALFFEDLYRSAPFDPTISIPNFSPGAANPGQTRKAAKTSTWRPTRKLKDLYSPETLKSIHRIRETWRNTPYLSEILSKKTGETGSNWWVVDGAHSESGFPILANDPHLGLDTPPVFYEIHLTVSNDPRNGPMNVNGVSFAGAPTIAQGCNDRICWGSTVNPMDVTDYYQEFLLVNIVTQLPTATIFGPGAEPLVVIPQTFNVNQVGDMQPDNLTDAGVGPTQGGLTFLVPRRNMGPIIDVDASNLASVRGISVQYTGFRATREIEAFFRWSRARNVEQFKEALQYFDFGSQNFSYADVDGNIAYFTSAELPLREDLQSGTVDGAPPFMIRDGSHQRQNEWLALTNRQFGQANNYEILPFDEMPQTVNPEQGYIANANNDPIGTTLDNNPFNQLRPGGGIYYLSPGYDGYRIGRIGRLLEAELADGGKLSVEEMMRIQSNNQLIDAEALTPYIVQALANGQRFDAPESLGALAADPRVVEAVQRLAAWDFSTPTGIQAGYDPGDDPDNLPEPSQAEIDNSVAATIYSVWRGQAIRGILDTTLASLGLAQFTPPSALAPSALRNLLDRFETNHGVGASGVNFFQVVEIENPADARDFMILSSLSQALNLLASNDFAAAFNNSTNQADYRWGYLHRIVYDHLIGGPFNIPPGGGFANLGDGLPGIARAGGFGAVDASAHSSRANSINGFMFGSGPARRFVGELDPAGIRGFEVIPGGQSGIVGTPHQASQLGRWLTDQYHPLRLTEAQVDEAAVQTSFFVPSVHRLYFPYNQADANRFTGYAASNLAVSAEDLEFTNWNADGTVADLPDNPRGLNLQAGAQTAQLGSDLFPGIPQSGWVELNATVAETPPLLGPALGSFTQIGTFPLRALDGGVAFTSQAKQLTFTRVFEGASAFRGQSASTILSLANPNSSVIRVRLRLLAGESPTLQGGETPPTLTREVEIPAKGSFTGSLSEIFEEPINQGVGYVEGRVLEGRGVVGTELVRVGEGNTLLGLNGSAGNGQTIAYSAQMASGPDIFTSLKLINTSEASRQVTLTATDNNGTSLAQTVTLNLAPGEEREAEVRELFNFVPAAVGPSGFVQFPTIEGSLQISTSGEGIIGDVIFGDPDDLTFAAALPLQTTTFRRAVFSQVANTDDFFTGLALLNPGAEAAEVTIQVFDVAGQSTGQTTLNLAAGARRADLVSELTPTVELQSGGYIVVTSNRPLVAQQLFGTYSLSLLSAVPPTVVE